jgi:tRNA(Ile)-lysidine synthase
LAHHADDQVELFFLRLLRGAGGEGLAGMRWRSPSPVDRNVTLIRPLLGATKAELHAFARENKIRFREDATNALLATPRNRIRNELLPWLRKKYQPGLTKTVLRLMDIIGAEADAVGDAARQWLMEPGRDAVSTLRSSSATEDRLRRPRTARRAVTTFEHLPVAVQRRVLQLQLGYSGILADFELVERLRRAPGVFVSIGPDFSVARDAGGTLKLRRQRPDEFDARELAVNLAGRAGEAGFAGVRFRWDFRSGSAVWRGARRAGSRGRSSRQTEFFDADRVGGQITLRHWRPGDRFQPIGMKSPLKLQDWFVNQKVPRTWRRELIVAVAEAGGIFWVEGLRISERYKLTPQTKRRLIWRWQRAEKEGNL